MTDFQKHVDHWRKGAGEDIRVAEELIAARQYRHGLFFAHLAIEKMVKALLIQLTRKMPPKIHNLGRLAELARVQLAKEQALFLQRMNDFQLEGRYPEIATTPVKATNAKTALKQAHEFLQWLKLKF